MLLTQVFIFVMLCYQNILCDSSAPCEFEDTHCLTEGTKRVYGEFAAGNPNGVPSSDPIHVELIEADLPTVKYTLRNVTLVGMKNCVPELVKINIKELKFEYNVFCNDLDINGAYEIKGKLGTMDIEGKGELKIDISDYVFLFTGDLEQTFDKDEKLHLLLKKHKLDIDARGKVVYNLGNLFNGNDEKSAALHKYANENWKEVDKIVRQPTMEKLMSVFINNANAYMGLYPAEHLLHPL